MFLSASSSTLDRFCRPFSTAVAAILRSSSACLLCSAPLTAPGGLLRMLRSASSCTLERRPRPFAIDAAIASWVSPLDRMRPMAASGSSGWDWQILSTACATVAVMLCASA